MGSAVCLLKWLVAGCVAVTFNYYVVLCIVVEQNNDHLQTMCKKHFINVDYY